jgi:hypothetical protein
MRWMGLLHEVGRLEPAGPTAENREAAIRQWGRRQQAGTAAVTAVVSELLEPDAQLLRLPLPDVIELFNTVLLGATMRTVEAARRGVDTGPPDTRALVDLLLHGVLAPTPTDRSS